MKMSSNKKYQNVFAESEKYPTHLLHISPPNYMLSFTLYAALQFPRFARLNMLVF